MSLPIPPEASVQPPRSFNTKKMAGKRVAMITYSPYPQDPRPRRALNALVEEGATVDIICLAGTNGTRRESFAGINVLRIPIKHQRGGALGYAYQYGLFIFLSAAIVALRSLRRRYDLVYVHNMPDVLVLSALVPKALGARVVLDLHDPMPELMMTIFRATPNSGRVKLLKWLEKWSIARADLVLTVNIACKRIFSSRSCHEDKIGVVMNAPDGRIFPYRDAPSSCPASRPIDKPFVVMYHGSIVERNGLDVAIEAVERVRTLIPGIELRIFGASNPYLERMMQAVHEKNLQDKVHYLGARSQEDIVKEIESCDLGVIPNHYNEFTEINTPTRIFEYLSLGRAVIAPSTSGIRDYFSDDALLFFLPGNPADLARGIEYAFHHPQETLQITRKGQGIYLQHLWTGERKTLVQRVAELFETKQQLQPASSVCPAAPEQGN